MHDSSPGTAVYRVRRFPEPPLGTAWDRTPWSETPPLTVGLHMGVPPAHRPFTQAKLAYDAQTLYVMFRVEDRWVRAVASALQDPVCRDSCVEFFFTPGGDVSQGYFNIEMNCGGTMLLNFQRIPRKDAVRLSAGDCAHVQIVHSLPSRVDPERTEPVTWTVEYRFPFRILRGCACVDVPAPGVMWRANFYKCADATSHPHWLTWAPVHRPQPDFHVPECFGTLLFE